MDSAERTLDYYIDGERVQTVGLQPAFNRLPPGASIASGLRRRGPLRRAAKP